MRRPQQLGQMLRPWQEKATSRSWPQASHRARVNPSENTSALEEAAQLLLDVARQSAVVVLARVGEERLEMLAHQAVKDGFRGSSRPAGGSERCHDPGLRGAHATRRERETTRSWSPAQCRETARRRPRTRARRPRPVGRSGPRTLAPNRLPADKPHGCRPMSKPTVPGHPRVAVAYLRASTDERGLLSGSA